MPEQANPQEGADASGTRERNVAYDLFIVTLTLISLGLMLLWIIPAVSQHVKEIAFFVDTLISFVLMFDFFRSLVRAPDRLAYLKWGWMDFLGSLPALPALRILRIWRLIRAVRILRRTNLRELGHAVASRPADSSLMAVILVSILLLGLAAFLILATEEDAANANITSALDAIWWAVVSVTTVGYGDKFPVTVEGRIVAFVLMVAGIGVFSVLTSFLSSAFVDAGDDAQEAELARIRAELQEIRGQLQVLNQAVLDQD